MSQKARFIEPMLLTMVDALPDERGHWEYGFKLDGYRAVAYRSGNKVHLRSRNNKDFTTRYPIVLKGLAGLPPETVIDGELVALDEEGRPSFSLLQNAIASRAPIRYYVFDVMMLAGRDVMHLPLSARRELLKAQIAPKLAEPVHYEAPLDGNLATLIALVQEHCFEGLIAKRLDSPYLPGVRTTAWRKKRFNQSQEFVIGGYTIGSTTFDAVILGYYEGDRLLYVARTRSGFTPALRAQLFKAFKAREIASCPFANLPEKKSGGWSQGLTKEKMPDCRWLKPELVAEVEFVEWTIDNHLRHTKFVRLRDDVDAREVTRA